MEFTTTEGGISTISIILPVIAILFIAALIYLMFKKKK